jgi:Na+-translocating ferredoxin:NAD+ oxidoreductase RNF subunit RnfB
MQEKMMDEYEKFLEKHITTCDHIDIGTGRRAMLDMALTQYRAFKAKAVEATAEGSLVEKLNDILPLGTALCGECGGNGYVLEKSGMGEEQDPIACPDCHGRGLRNISELGYRPASPAVEELVRELKNILLLYDFDSVALGSLASELVCSIKEIIAKYDNAKGR